MLMPPLIGKYHDEVMASASEGYSTIMNSCVTLYAKDKLNYIFPVTKLTSIFPTNENNDGVEYVALF